MSDKTEVEIEIPERVYNVYGTINQQMAQDFLDWALEIEYFDNLLKKEYPDIEIEPVTINISSAGGECAALDAMFDAIDLLDCPIVTRTFGVCMSCALWLFARGDVRTAGESTSFMWHQILWGNDGSLADHEEMLKNSKSMQTRYDKHLIERTLITKQILDKHRKNDWYFRKDEAIELGLVNFTGKQNSVFNYGDDDCE